MILVASQRSGCQNLAKHLLKAENDHVEVAQLRDFSADNLRGALNEIQAIALGTKCKQPMFSLSVNPPIGENVSTESFFKAIDKIEERLGLSGQPRAIVFHEKEGRRHAHVVFSRIRADEEGLKAIPLPFFKLRLKELARELWLENGFKNMPQGLMSSNARSATNFDLEDWQKAKRLGIDPRDVKEAMLDAWATSNSRETFAAVLESRGFKLAQGDRRGFVAVGIDGGVWAVAKATGLKARDVRAKLGESADLPSVEERKQEFAGQITTRLQTLREANIANYKQKKDQFDRIRNAMVLRQTGARTALSVRQEERVNTETAARQERFNTGLRGLIDRISGRHREIKSQNEMETYQSVVRDRSERDTLIFSHIEERQQLQNQIGAVRKEHQVRANLLVREIHALGSAEVGRKAVIPVRSEQRRESIKQQPKPTREIGR